MTEREALEEAVRLFETYSLVASAVDAGRWINNARAALAATPAVGGELLPCPFCGSLPQLISENGLHVVMCTHYHCQAATLALSTEKGAIENWNQRAAQPVSPLRGRDSERCPTCHHTDEEYAAGDWTCADPWHADDHLRAKSASPPEQPAAETVAGQECDCLMCLAEGENSPHRIRLSVEETDDGR